MKKELTIEELLLENEELASRLEEAEQLIDAIKAGEVDAFALNRNNKPEIFTLQTGDYGYRMLVENINEGALTLSEDGLIVYTNRYFHHLLRLSYSDTIGKSIFTFIHADSLDSFNALFGEAISGRSKGEINIIAGEKIIPVYLSLSSLDQSVAAVGIIVTDLTERKVFQKQIEEKAAELEIKNQELQVMNKELESFAYISSHDLQEPLRKIQTFVSRITEVELKNVSDTGKQMFGRVNLAAKRMQTLIDDLLAYSRSNKAEHKLETVDLNSILEEVKEDLTEELSEKRAVVEVGATCSINVIPFQFRQMLHNLIGNSLKFSKPDVEPHIKITSEILSSYSLLEGKKVCHITLTDNGIGFDQQYADKIFMVFQRLHTRTEFDGTGIGLAIVKKIIENHNGIITAVGTPGEGARFDIYIPSS